MSEMSFFSSLGPVSGMMDPPNQEAARSSLWLRKAGLGLFVFLVAAAGTSVFLWSRSSSSHAQAQSGGPDSGSAKPKSSTSADTTTAPPPLVDGWPLPAFVLAITGQQHGYIEPCGCSPKQSGGLARRSDLLRQLRDVKKWPVLALETGGTLEEARVTRHQSALKFNMILESLNGMGYRALGLGTEELNLGALKLFEIFSERNVQEEFDLPFLAANVVLLGAADLGTPKTFRILDVGGKTVAVTSVFGNEFQKELSQSSLADLTITAPAIALPPVIAAMQAGGNGDEKKPVKKPDMLVLLSYDSVENSRALAKKFPEFDVVVSAAGADDPGNEHETIGKTLFFVSGMKGKSVNLIGFYPGEKVRIRFERAELDQDRFGRDPKVRELMAQYQALLKEEWLEPTSELRSFNFAHESGLQFMGAKACAGCHASAYDVWENSKHAHATASLLEGQPAEQGTWIDRTYDPECLCCHATGWNAQEAYPYTDGFIDLGTTPQLAGIQCENCHGPGSEHVKLETDWKQAGGAISDALTASRNAVRITKAQAEKKVCLKCHDFANSPKFDFNVYWPDIEHPTPDSEKKAK